MTSFLRSLDFDEESDIQGFTTLHKIVCGLDFRDLDSELDTKPDCINKLDVYGRSALWYSFAHKSPHFVSCLLRRGADLNAGGNSVVAEAIRSGTLEILELLIASGSHFGNLNTEDFLTAWRSVQWNYSEMYGSELLSIERIMIKHLVDVNHQSRDGRTMLMEMCRSICPGASRMKQLIRHGADLEVADNNGWTALLHTLRTPDPEAFQTLVRAGARLDVRTHSGFTILHVVVLPTYRIAGETLILEAIRDLDLSGLDIDARDEDGFTAFDLLKKRNGITWESYCRSKFGIWYHQRYRKRVDVNVDIIRSLESLFHHIQDSQGIPLEHQYPPLAEYPCEKPDEDIIPGAWPL